LTLLLKTGFPAIFPRLVQIHIIASGVMWILVNNLKVALQRADRAEEIAKLQHDVAAMTSAQAEQKQALERQIEDIVQVHVQVANGNLSARVPLTPGTLWQLAGPLNVLIGRYQRARQAEEQMQHLLSHLSQAQRALHEEVAEAVAQQRPLHLPQDALFGPLYQELNGKLILQTPSQHAQRLFPR
jgi:hypothetical protein